MAPGEDTGGGSGTPANEAVASPEDATLGTFDPPPSPPQTGFVEGQSQELPELRTETRKVFQNPDGTKTLRPFPDPVHFRDDSGVMQDIDPRLERRGGKVTNVGGPIRYEPTEEASGTVSDHSPDGSIGTRLPTSNGVSAEIVGNNAIYRGAIEGGDIVTASFSNGLEYGVVLTDPVSPAMFFDFEVESTLEPRVSSDGRLEFADASGRVVAKGGRPEVWDLETRPTSSRESSKAIRPLWRFE